MHRRCDDPSDEGYKNYGGRGIKVCKRWNDLTVFVADVGTRPSPQHSIDRINNDGNYEPGNVRWATWREQNNNKRHSLSPNHVAQDMTIDTRAHEYMVKVLVEARRKLDLRQHVVAKFLGVSQTWIARVEGGDRRLDVIEFVRLARVLKLDPVEVFGRVMRRVK